MSQNSVQQWGGPFPSLHMWPVPDTFVMKMIHLPPGQRVSMRATGIAHSRRLKLGVKPMQRRAQPSGTGISTRKCFPDCTQRFGKAGEGWVSVPVCADIIGLYQRH